jgi:hypothetical protein
VVRGQRVADREAGVVTDQREPLVAEGVHQRRQVTGLGGGVVPARGLVGQPDAPLVDGDDLEVLGQRRHQETPRVPVLRPAVHEQQRRSAAADDGVQAHLAGIDVAAGEGVGETGRKLRCPGNGTGPFRDREPEGR